MKNNPLECYREDVDIEYLYDYMNSRLELKNSGFEINSQDSVIYFKLRHNCFKSLVLYGLGLPNYEEKPFFEFGIDSDKTPDFLYDMGDYFLLIEFTVSNKFETSLTNKLYFKKYDDEIAKLTSFKLVRSYFFVLSLDKDPTDLAELIKLTCTELEIYPVLDFQISLNQLKHDFSYINFHVNTLMPELLVNKDVIVQSPLNDPIILQEPFSFSEGDVGIKTYRKEYLLKVMWKSSNRLLSQAKRLSRRLKFLLNFNVDASTGYFFVDSSGSVREDMVRMIEMREPLILNYTKFINVFSEDLDPFKKMSVSEIDGDYNRPKRTNFNIDTAAYESRLKKRLFQADESTLDKFELGSDSNYDMIQSFILEKRKEANNIVVRNKNPLQFPSTNIYDYGDLDVKHASNKPVTSLILRKMKPIVHSEKIIEREPDLDLFNESLKNLSRLNREFQSLGLKPNRSANSKESVFPDIDLTQKPELDNLCEQYVNHRSNYTKGIGEYKRSHYRNRVTISKTFMKENWEEEMIHFKKDHSKIELCNEFDFDLLDNLFKSFLTMQFSECDTNSPDLLYGKSVPIGIELKNMCLQMGDKLKENNVTRLNLAHNLLLISRLCYSLGYYSNVKSNSTDFFYDNLGYKNVLLLVRGGKKILSTRRSRLFKFIYPIDDISMSLIFSESNEIINVDGINYCITPWRNWSQVLIKKGTELYYTFLNYYNTSFLESGLPNEDFNKFISMKVLNMFSQRRKTEMWCGNFRYLYFNSLGTHTKYSEMLSSMIDYDYDPLIYYYQRLLMRGYDNIRESAKDDKLYDLIHGCTVSNFDLCAERFDESLFMAKAPFDHVNEHIKNLRSVLETHQAFLDKYSTLDPIEILEKTDTVMDDDYVKNLFSDDFKFDSKLCYLIGRNCSKLLNNFTSKEVLSEEFSDLLMRTFTKIKTSKGMRSSTGDFWGKKGFDVLFKDKPNYSIFMQQLLEMEEIDYRSIKRVFESSQETFFDAISTSNELVFEFDVKDKEQFKGSREIYVMSDKTKMMQAPLEDFFKKLCNHMPNELINKPSNIRPRIIHTKVYEDVGEGHVPTYCTLDCRKWAPRSNLWKYLFFIMGLKPILPDSFFMYFMSAWKMYFRKKVRIQSKFANIIKGNRSTEKLFDLLTEREDGDFEFQMPYSFMMGIFNYLSSLFHAASQNYFNEIISEPAGVVFKLLAHSDDSGGIIYSDSYEKNVKFFGIYEVFQKACNHLMSLKKSSLSKRSFEIISIMYRNKRLIPMTHKFISNIAFDPKGKGWFSDISSVISKVIEIFSNGGSLLQCYGAMLSMSEMIRKFYHIHDNELLSRVPLAFGGVPNFHPLHLIFLGSSSQELLLEEIEAQDMRDFRINTYEIFGGRYIPGKPGELLYYTPYLKQHEESVILEEEDNLFLTFLSRTQKNKTLSDYLDYKMSLNTQSFVYSLTGVDSFKLYFSTVYRKTHIKDINCKKGVALSEFNQAYISSIVINQKSPKKYELPYSNFQSYIRAAERMNFNLDHFTIESAKTCKPIMYNNFLDLGLNLSFDDVMNVVGYLKSEKFRKTFQTDVKIKRHIYYLCNTLNLRENELGDSLMKMSKSDFEKTRSAYLFLPSGVNVDTLERFWTFCMMYCTRRYRISSKKPIYFTMEKILDWNMDYQSLKHYYLLIKIIKNNNVDEKLSKLLLENSSCQKCNLNSIQPMVEEMLKIKAMRSFDEKIVNLPFITYQTPQRFGQTVWYGSSELTLYTKSGHVTLRYKDSVQILTFYISDSTNLAELWYLLKNCLESRGILLPKAVLSHNYSNNQVLGFNSMNHPISVNPGSNEMILVNSKIVYHDEPDHNIRLVDNKHQYNYENCDFEIYQNYDINKHFFDEHHLKELQEYILTKDLVVPLNDLMKNFMDSRCYQIISLDEHQRLIGTLKKKYSPAEYLGSDCSLTKALFLADNIGMIRYRTSANPDFIDSETLDSHMSSTIPTLDLIAKLNFSRITLNEKRVMDKIAYEDALNDSDKMIFEGIVSKLGLSTAGLAITIQKDLISQLNPAGLAKLPTQIVMNTTVCMLKAIHDSMKVNFNIKSYFTYNKNPRSFWDEFLFHLEFKNTNSLATLLFKGYNRAVVDNLKKVWDITKEDRIASFIKFNKKTAMQSLRFARFLIVTSMKNDDFVDKIMNFRLCNVSKIDLGAFNDIKEGNEENEAEEIIEPQYKVLNKTNFWLEDLDMCDYVTNVDYIDEDDEDSELVMMEREFEGSEFEYFVCDDADLTFVQENTLLKDYSKVTIKSVSDPAFIPWFGSCDIEVEKFGGIDVYVTTFPGEGRQAESLIKIFSDDIGSKDNLLRLLEDSRNLSEERERIQNPFNEYDKFYRELEKIGIENPDYYLNKLRPDLNMTFEEIMRDCILNIETLIADFTKKREKRKIFNILPGFTGIVKDPKLCAELNSMFGPNFHQLFNGSVTMTQASVNNHLRSIDVLLRQCNDSQKSILMFCSSLIRDIVISKSSTSWFSDSLNSIIDIIYTDLEEEEDDRVIALPTKSTDTFVLEYDEIDPFE